MKVVFYPTVFVLFIVASATMAIAQPPGGGPGGERPGGPGGGPGDNDPGRAVLIALDTNGDHEISAAEIKNAAAALLKLDTNGDGKLNENDLVAGGQRAGQQGGRQGGRPQGPPPRPEGADAPRRQGAGGPPEPEQMVQQAMEFDADKDGKLDKTELLKFIEQLGPPPGGPEGGQGDRPQRPNRPGG